MDASTAEILFIALFIGGLVAVTKILAEQWTRRRLINTRLEDPAAIQAYLESGAAAERRTALKWGCLAISIGAGLVLVDSLNFSEGVAAGLLFILGGLGLLVFRSLSRRES